MAGIYLHIPFCKQRCIYCDFYFVTGQRLHPTFVQALCTEIEYYGQLYGRLEPIETIYFGGGTPSRLSLEEVARVLNELYRHFDLSALQEVTFEVNPEDASRDYLSGLHSLGINRLSIGVQSFYEADLRFMNRAHTAEQAEAALENARRAGFENFNVDLIFGLPDQPLEYWMANLQKVADRDIPHVSTYSLTIEPRTVLYKQVERGLVQPADEETYRACYDFAMEYLEARGYEHYEISNFARPGYQSRHNHTYWRHGNYLGFGPSAHSFWWGQLPEPGAYRWANVRNIRRYEALLGQHHLPLEFREGLSYDQLAEEYLFLRLRTAEGLDLDHYAERYGVDLLSERLDELAELEAEGLIEPIRNGKLRLSRKGRHVCDAIVARLL
ncbi:oxygen-independent coproporphyrinogen III oxidase [Rhodothermus marinus SG0.5JP17-172]|uniref:radical SAM family heme chaperone HemW n=1 Tax=Rhodothermus marinus TaxID=29549 RepID=UPI000223D77A|nr:radical SAM family heme chaperone HemW [Rhodothermus marinus]AEN73842.1 oxygen-independent coproporphyrinogen III oxidase [Rhodothermus marinus SG0.5JP17-172]